MGAVHACVLVYGVGGGGGTDKAIHLCHLPSPAILSVDSCRGPGGGGGASQIPVPELFWAVVSGDEGPWSSSALAWVIKVASGVRTEGMFHP